MSGFNDSAAIDRVIASITLQREQAWDAHDELALEGNDDDSLIPAMNAAFAVATIWDFAYAAAIDEANEMKSL